VFGAPEPVPDHADRALVAASDLLAAVDSELGERCRVGIGVNSWLVVVGTIGAGDVMELGVVGDPVNVAARVQDATRELGERLLATAATRVLLEDQRNLEPRGTISLRGKPEPIAVYGCPPDSVTLPGRLTRRKDPGWQL
jgi:adenylate cyclase